ncbi:uncharacterized protein LOC119645303 [Glossina fuscipes]|uniref:Uncharacterized protein LOC119645303 n=1 Tax=Glossina fuscipes TaxID=7396 RepID=A0A9C6E2S7_9MUSC|nr:uncharacterized protein LOC119645303 [Glossina fuscipes]
MALLNALRNCINLIPMGLIVLTAMLEYTQARIGYFWHITDLHLDTIYSTQGDVMRSCWHIERQTPSSSAHLPGRYGDYLCDSPWSLIESAAEAMKSRQGDNVEFVLWTGDGLSHSAHPMSELKKLEILRNITDLLGRTFSSQFVFPVLGHEDGTTTNFRHMGELWRHWLPTEALYTFEKGGYYSIEQTKSRLRIIALNTNFMRHDPKYSQSHLAAVRQRMPTNGGPGVGGGAGAGAAESTEYKNYYYHHGNLHQHHGHASDWTSPHSYGYNGHHRGISVMPGGGISIGMGSIVDGARVSALSEYENQDTEKQWLWLEDVLSKSKISKETVYIVGHIPPGSDERHIGLQQNGHTTFTESNNKRYLELVRKYSSIIQGQFFGHLHSDSFRIIYDDKGKPVSWMMISPSVTPRKMSIGSNNPAMRLYKFDTDSGQVLDYTQYYTDLSAANTNVEPNWVPEYNLTHYYALTDISAISLHNFVDRFTSGDESWFLKYYRANTVRYHNDRCDAVCMLNHYCAITRIDYKEFRQCLEKEQNALRSKAIRSTLDRKSVYVLALMLFVMNMMRIHRILRWLAWNYTKVITTCQQRCQPLLFGMRRQKSNATITISEFHNAYMKPMTTMVKRMCLRVDWSDILSSSSHMHYDIKTKDFLADIKSYRVETIITITEADKTTTNATNLVKVRTHTCNYCLQQKPEQSNDVTERFSSISIKPRYTMAVMVISAIRAMYSNRFIGNALIILNNNFNGFHFSRSPQRCMKCLSLNAFIKQNSRHLSYRTTQINALLISLEFFCVNIYYSLYLTKTNTRIFHHIFLTNNSTN